MNETERDWHTNVSMKYYLKELRDTSEKLKVAEESVDILRDCKWECVRALKKLGHDFTATTEGVDVILSSPPSFKWS
jgi:hypothetical protein